MKLSFNTRSLAIILILCLHLLIPKLLAEPSTQASQDRLNLKERSRHVLWFNKPATRWQEEAFPIGNGMLAAMIFSGVEKERIQFNEESLWIGDEEDTGAYQAFGDIFVEFDTKEKVSPGGVTNYRRELDIDRSIHKTEYKLGGINYTREAFASHPAKVIVVRFKSDRPHSLTGKISLTDMHKAKISSKGDTLTSVGSLANYVFNPIGGPQGTVWPKGGYDIALQYEAQVKVLNEGGEIKVDKESIRFNQVSTLTLILSAGTNFVQDRSQKWQGEHPHTKVTERIQLASKRSWDDLFQEHLKDYQNLFNRVSLDLGKSAASAFPTNVRVEKMKDFKEKDPEYEALLFQYARYLMISCSRAGGLPANLQGKWNESNNPPWRCDYHTDINVQMCYWPTDVANLSECFQPYADWLDSIREVRKESTYKAFGKKRGWIIRAESGLFGGSTWRWIPGCSAWLVQNSYDHYLFTQNQEYLKNFAYPVMKEIAEYWVDSLVRLPDGTLITPNGYSPEQGPEEPGIAFDLQMVWDLFTNTIEAAEVLGVDVEFKNQLVELKKNLLPPKVGSWGQVMEWMKEPKAFAGGGKEGWVDTPENVHRHISHLVGLYPGRQISVQNTLGLADAARVTLNARRDEGEGWSTVNKVALWARLQEGERSYQLIRGFFNKRVFPNLLSNCPPFVIDANFGYLSAVCEMLLQSHLDEIHLLPALPKAWDKGSVVGLKARGGFLVDIDWDNGKVINYKITSPVSKKIKVRVNGVLKTEIIKNEKNTQ